MARVGCARCAPPIIRIAVADRLDTICAAGWVVSLQGGVARESDDLLF